jgi:cytochrome P450
MRSLPPGPRLPVALQTAIWFRRAQWFLAQCAARWGESTWIPFGGGVRRCLGGAFAQFEMRAVLSELMRRRQLFPARPEPERVLRRAITETPRRDAELVIA